MDLVLGSQFAWQWARYPEDEGRSNAYSFMALQRRGTIDPELLKSDYQSNSD
jgi:hypothetical protein